MALKNIQTNRIELQEYLQLILKIPEKLNKIDIDIKKELLIDIDNRIKSITKDIVNRISYNPNYQYPEYYLPDKLFDYWALNVSQLFNYNELKYLENLITNNLTPLEDKPKQKDYKKNDWFIIGLLIVTGEIEMLLIKHKNPTQLAKFLNPNKWSSYKTYIGDSMNYLKTITRNTNIFNDPDKIIKLYNHCVENNILMTEKFINEYNKTETE